MSWFEEQLNYRERSDNADFDEAIDSIAGAVMGIRLKEALNQKDIAGSAIEEILRFYHCRFKREELPAQIKTVDEQIEYRMHPFNIKYRSVRLEKGWYNDAVGAMLGTMKEDGTAVALIPGRLAGYRLINIKTGQKIMISSRNEGLIDNEAICFYESLPQKALTIGDLLKFMMQQLSLSDIALFLILMALSALIGMLSPLFTKWIFSDVLETESLRVLAALAVFMTCYTIGQTCFGAFHGLINACIGTKQSIAVQAAVMSRIMSLPPTFFRKYSAGELSKRADYINSLCSTMFETIGMTGIASLFSLIYVVQIFTFAPAMVAPSLIMTLASLVLTMLTTFIQMGITKEKMEISALRSGLTYSIITGIQKIKLAGAEKRMFSRWARQYAEEAALEYNPPLFIKLGGTCNLAVSMIGTIVLYGIAINRHISVSDFYAFNTAYAMVSAAFMSVVSIAVSIADIRPTLEMAGPIMEAEPERHEKMENITSLRGAIELSHVSFRYDESLPNVIDDLSLRIQSGEYVAIVGETGCGKSTLLRLLLGFERPQKGSIFYDRKDIAKIDLESLRRKIGVVLQDGKLFVGDIFSNIMITAPELGMDAAWEAAEISSIADDIRAMPMGMSTMIGEGQGGISGGQKQRLMIARAVAAKPKILMFDEATSALDNITQKKVSDAIDTLKCTRIIIAHRLSTIRNADRIIFLEKGKIAEEGTYEELIAQNGYFARLVERQRLDIATDGPGG